MEQILTYIAEGEHQKQVIKLHVNDEKKIMRTLSAFANMAGGRLLVGVKDNGKIVGTYPQEVLRIIQSAASLYCRPILSISSIIHQIKNKLVLEINVVSSEIKPIMAKDENDKWKAYIRQGNHTLFANKILINSWKKKDQKIVRPEILGEKELFLLNVITKNTSLTLSQIYRLSKLNKNFIDQWLVLFILWNLVEIKITSNGTFFSTV